MIPNFRKEKNIVFYGAGSFARALYLYLYSLRLSDRISCVVVTDKQGQSFYGYPVIGIDEIDTVPTDALVCIAVHPENAQGLPEQLMKIGIRRVWSMTEEFKNQIPALSIEQFKTFPIQRNRVFFDSFNGAGFSCNGKYIAEELLRRNNNIQLVWDIRHEEKPDFPEEICVVVRNTLEFYEMFYTSAVVVSNMHSAYWEGTRKDQYVIDTWHGTGPFKKIGVDTKEFANDIEKANKFRKEMEMVDLAIAASERCVENFRSSYLYEGEIGKWGYPRNDIFFSQEPDLRNKVLGSLGISPDRKIALYAPTFRYDASDYKSKRALEEIYDLGLEEVRLALQERFGDEFQILYRFHHRTYRSNKYGEMYQNAMDVTHYPDMQELLAVSDVLISDWSSSVWDYALTGKPIFLYYHDADEVDADTGFYQHPDKYPFPKGHSTEELCMAIRNFDQAAYPGKVSSWMKMYESYDDGHAAERIADRILDVLDHPEKYGKEQA